MTTMTMTDYDITTKRDSGATLVTATVRDWQVRWNVSDGPVYPRGRPTVRHSDRVKGAQAAARFFIDAMDRHLNRADAASYYRPICADLLRRWATHGNAFTDRRYERPMKDALRAAAGGRATKRQRERLAAHIARRQGVNPDTVLAEAVIICCEIPRHKEDNQ